MERLGAEADGGGPQGVSIDQTTGDLYVSNQGQLRVEVFSATGDFIRAFGQDVVASGPDNTVSGGLETCSTADLCKTAAPGQTGGALGETSSYGALFRGRLAVVPVGAPNEGNVVLADPGNQRVQEFTSSGVFVRAFGFDVVASGPDETGTGFEVCNSSAGDVCKAGTSGTAVGQFSGGQPERVAVDETGAIYTVEQEVRVQKFTPQVAPPALSPEIFGQSETQAVKVSATGGLFRLSFKASTTPDISATATASQVESALNALPSISDAGQATGDVSSGSTTINNMVVTAEPLSGGRELTGAGIAPGTTIEFYDSFNKKLHISQPATASGVGVPLTALSGNPGSVTVAGGPGDAGGSSPYEVTFSGGRFANSNPPSLVGQLGTAPLGGGTGATANQAVVTTPTIGGPNSSGYSDGPVDVAIGAGDHVFVAKTFPAGSTSVCPDGSVSPNEQHFQELTAAGTTVDEDHGVCNGIKPQYGSADFIPVSGMAVDPGTGYLYDSRAPNGNYPREEENRVYILAPGGPPTVSLDAIDEVSSTSAVIKGSLTPNSTTSGVPGPVPTLIRLEYKLAGSPSWTVYGGDFGAGAGFSPRPVAISLDGLEPNRSYEVRLVVTKQFHEGIAITPPQQLDTLPAAPRIEAFFANNVTGTTADLHALINPLGQDSTYTFEYGTTTAYGSSAPIPAGDLPAGESAVPVTTQVTGLDGGLYHFRVVAKNDAGTSTTGDQTFSFYPPSCPNESVRQQTGAAFLPDCRAYELVSPARAGNVILTVGGPPASDATNPPRFAFEGFLGGVNESGQPTAISRDVYVSTRTVNGWVTRYTGLAADEGATHGGPPDPESGEIENFASDLGSLSLNRILDWDFGQSGFVCCGKLGYTAPNLYDAAGNKLGKLPTNLAEVPGSTLDMSEGGFKGALQPSPDFSHYVFSTADLQFAPGGLLSAPGSVYDNDVEDGSTAIVSKTAAGDIPPGTGGSKEVIRIPAVSDDGSHILMSTKAGPASALTPVHLYMSIDRKPAYDVSIGQDGLNHGVTYQGMTSDGGSVYFSSPEQLTADDHDESVDLFVWKADEPDTLTRVSKGADGSGDSDQCASSWITRCGIQVVPLGAKTDNALASSSGDIYFYSPEQLVAGKGVPGQRNLYVYRGGSLHHIVALDANATLDRIQVTSDGDYLAVLTRAKLTSYDNAGFDEMYTYQVDAGGPFKCASCVPDGGNPTKNVEASEDGIFLANDGRAFFTTGDPLVPEDINAKLRDVYEFVDNRPQLISSGSSPRDTNALIGVSRDGTNVYFTTMDSLVGQDRNGPFRKFYDARTGGGFPFTPPQAPCQAADECHGPSSAGPPPVAAGTSVPLGNGGNAATKSKSRKKKNGKGKKRKKHKNSATRVHRR